jgi:hypothetical protein
VESRLREPVAIAFYPENAAVPAAIQHWQQRNPDWRQALDDVIVCPVCGITVRAIADFALLDADGVRREIVRFRDEYLRAACSDHFWPTEEYWAVRESQVR